MKEKKLLNKKDICKEIAKSHGMTYEQIKRIMNTLSDIIERELLLNGGICLRGLLKIKMRECRERQYRKPNSEETIIVKKKYMPRVALSRSFRQQTWSVTDAAN